MSQKNDFWNESNDSEAPFENKEEKALATPENYYHEPENESNTNKKEDRYYDIFEKSKNKHIMEKQRKDADLEGKATGRVDH